MRIFEEFNEHGKPCPICKTRDNKKSVLIGVMGTQEGHNIQAIQVHLDCLLDGLLLMPDLKFIGMRCEE